MSDTGRAAVFYGPHERFEIRELPVPQPEPGCVTLRIARANICGSELHIWRGDGRLGVMASPAGRVLGHEAVGVVHTLGDGVSHDWAGHPVTLGDRIAYQYFAPCGRCRSCRRGMTEACRHSFDVQQGPLDEFPYFRGSFGDFFYLWPQMAFFKVPDHVTDTMVVSANCALSQVIMGLERVGVGLGDRVVIQGAGGLGVYATAIAKERGASLVAVIDGIDERLALAGAMGADELIDFRSLPEAKDRIARVQQLTDGWGADVVVEVVGHSSVINEGLRMLGQGGRYLEIGVFFTGVPFQFDVGRLTALNQRLECVASYSAESLARAIDFLGRNAGRLPLDEVVVDFPLDAINEAFAEQDAGKVRRSSLVMMPV
jgi:threonine dehydrogenase-like Zn-dependent dehydrogenase